MCGRFTLIDWEEMVERFGVAAEGIKPRYNIAPTQSTPVIIHENGPHLQMARWGLVPFWAKELSFGAKLINARAETVHENNYFRHSLKVKRCLIPADGFYEWKKDGTVKKPYRFTLQDKEIFAFAGLWDQWRSPNGDDIISFTIITTTANALVHEVHDRMPVILTKEAEQIWLDSRFQDHETLRELLVPYAATKMGISMVSPLVNTPNNDNPDVLRIT